MKFITLLTLLVSFSANSSDELKAVANLIFVSNTGIEAGKMCIGDSACHTWSTFIEYDAEIKQVISGAETDTRLKVIYARHSSTEVDMLDVTVNFKRLNPNNKLGAQYQIISIE